MAHLWNSIMLQLQQRSKCLHLCHAPSQSQAIKRTRTLCLFFAKVGPRTKCVSPHPGIIFGHFFWTGATGTWVWYYLGYHSRLHPATRVVHALYLWLYRFIFVVWAPIQVQKLSLPLMLLSFIHFCLAIVTNTADGICTACMQTVWIVKHISLMSQTVSLILTCAKIVTQAVNWF